jgi:hypothetical protein
MAITLLIKVLVSGLGISIVSYLCLCLALLIWQNRLIFFPSVPLEATPDQVGLSYQDVTIPVLTWQGKLAQLHGWWIPNPTSPDVLLYLHGNAGNIGVNLGPVQTFYKAGFSVLAIDYRGYGQSKGDFPKESEVYRDAQAAWKYLVNNRGIPPQHIFLYGHSLGGAIAIDLAVRHPVAGVIVDSTFTSMRDMARYHPIYNLFPIELILTQRFDSLAKLSLLKSPLLVIHGTEDRKVPTSLGRILFESATVPKKLFLIPCADHENTMGVAGKYYLQTVREFKELVRSQGGKRQQARQNGY